MDILYHGGHIVCSVPRDIPRTRDIGCRGIREIAPFFTAQAQPTIVFTRTIIGVLPITLGSICRVDAPRLDGTWRSDLHLFDQKQMIRCFRRVHPQVILWLGFFGVAVSTYPALTACSRHVERRVQHGGAITGHI